jgi:hypothetical protein
VQSPEELTEAGSGASFVRFLRARGESEATVLKFLLAEARLTEWRPTPQQEAVYDVLTHYRGAWWRVLDEELAERGITRGQLYAAVVESEDFRAGRPMRTVRIASMPIPHQAPVVHISTTNGVRRMRLARAPRRRNTRTGRAKARAPGSRQDDDPDPAVALCSPGGAR